MSMLNKGGDVFTLLGIQEDKEVLLREYLEQETIKVEDVNFLLGRNNGFRPHHFHVDYASDIQNEQNDD